MNKEVNRNDGLYREKQLKFYFQISKSVKKVELLAVRTDNPQILPVTCNQRILERMRRYRECRDKVKLLNRFYFKLKMRYPVKLEKGAERASLRSRRVLVHPCAGRRQGKADRRQSARSVVPPQPAQAQVLSRKDSRVRQPEDSLLVRVQADSPRAKWVLLTLYGAVRPK